MAVYDFTYLDNANTYTDILVGMNNMMNGVPGIAILLIIFSITFLASKKYDNITGLTVASYTTMLTSIFFYFSDLITREVFITCIFLTLGMTSILLLSKR